jgi:hypothetical protein
MRTINLVIRVSPAFRDELAAVAEAQELTASSYARMVLRKALDTSKTVDKSKPPHGPASKAKSPEAQAALRRMDQIAGMTYEVLIDADLDMCTDLLAEFRAARDEANAPATPVPEALKQRYNELKMQGANL